VKKGQDHDLKQKGEIVLASFRSYILKTGIIAGIKTLSSFNAPESIDERRRHIDLFAKNFSRLPSNCKVEPVQIEGLYSEWISNDTTEDKSVILYLHGGGYEYCSADTHRALAARIMTKSGVKVLLPEYRLSPEHPFPAAIEDSLSIYRWLLKQGYDSSNIIIAGDSAGGGLSLALSISLRDQGEPLPAAIVLLSPWADLTSSGESYKDNKDNDPYMKGNLVKKTALSYANGEPLTNKLISPIYAEFHDFPPMFIQVGSTEILLSDAKTLAKKASDCGVNVTLQVWQGMWHVFQASRRIPEGLQAISEIGVFIKKRLEALKTEV
jgi:epsilon-lactone hydrolase